MTTSIHDAILDYLETELTAALITDPTSAALTAAPEDPVLETDPAIAGIVSQGPLQGSPAPDKARISVTIHENDPDAMFGNPASSLTSDWSDNVHQLETSQIVTWRRGFSVKIRCLLVKTKETKAEARAIASTIRSRLEDTILDLDFTSVSGDNNESVSRKAIAKTFQSEMLQAGGPPNSFDYHIKVRFDVLTTTRSFA